MCVERKEGERIKKDLNYPGNRVHYFKEEMKWALPGPEICLVPACSTMITERMVKGNF